METLDQRVCSPPPDWGPFEEWGEEVDLSEEPTCPPPDPDQPYLWLQGRWALVVTDQADDEA